MKQTTRFQRLLSLVMAAAMLFSTAMPAFADENSNTPEMLVSELGETVEDPSPEVETTTPTSEEPVADPVSPEEPVSEGEGGENEGTSEPSETPAPEETATPTPESTPDSTPEPTPDSTPVPTEEPQGTPEPTEIPDTTATPVPEETPVPESEEEEPEILENSVEEETAADPEESSAPETPELEIIEMSDTFDAAPGDTVDFFVTTNVDAIFQWQKLVTEPIDTENAIYSYGEGESTDYYFPIEGMTEEELLEINPDATWPGIEIYYDQLARQATTFSNEGSEGDVSIEMGTGNYVLDPEAEAPSEDVSVWQDIEGETSSVYHHVVTEEDEYTTYRCVVTPVAASATATPETSEQSTAEDNSEDKPEIEPVISDSMHVNLPAEEQPVQRASLFRMFSFGRAATPSVSLSSDNQWVTGISTDLEYITKTTYDAQNASGANNAYWTKINGGARPDGSKYAATTLTDGDKMEVLSAWYGKTVYFRKQGESGTGTALDIPAYTDENHQSGKKTLYKNAIKVFNAWVPDTGASFYASYIYAAFSNGYTANNGHITIDKAPIDSFNRIPNSYLTNAEGDYIYDAVIIGAATLAEPDLSGAAAWAMQEYLGQGYGMLIGHDMLYGYGGVSLDPDYVPDRNSTTTPYYSLNTRYNGHYNMAWLIGQNKYYTETSPYSAASMILCCGDYTDKSTLYGDDSGTSKLRINTTVNGDPISDVTARVPTNYPYSAGQHGVPFSVGNTVDGSATHSNQQIAYGTIWIDYASNSVTSLGAGRLVTDTRDGLTGTNNFYLTSNGNFAMSQIGHKNGNKDVARIDECYLLANTLFYISQRQQCQVCQSQQGDNQDVHFVKRIYSAEELSKLANQEQNWFTYPMNGCYILAADITLPADWQPISGFTGHFDADGHTVSFAPGLAAENQRVFAQSGDGWNLGSDPATGTIPVYVNGEKTTGIARVVGFLSALFETDGDGWIGYKIVIEGSDGQEYTCVTNFDGKYVLSNIPCTGEQKARVYAPDGRQVTEYGPIRVNVPPAFWNTDETTVLYLLNFTPKAIPDKETYVGYGAVLSGGGVYFTEPVTDITWQVKRSESGAWENIDSVSALNGHYSTSSNFVNLGDESYTDVTLSLSNCQESWNGWKFRAVFKYLDKQTDTYSVATSGLEGKLTVKPWPMRVTQAADKEVWIGDDATFTVSAEYISGLTATWQYSRTGSGGWADVVGSGEFVDDGAIRTTSSNISNTVYNAIAQAYSFGSVPQVRTTTTISIKKASIDFYGYHFRVKFTSADGREWYSDASNNLAWHWDANTSAYGESQNGGAVSAQKGKLTVKPAQVATVLRPAASESGSVDHQIPSIFGTDVYGQYAKLATGQLYSNDTVTYTAIVYYQPTDGTVTPQWEYRLYGNRTPRDWNQSVASSIDSGMTTSVTNTDLGIPTSGSPYYNANYAGWRATKSVMTITRPVAKMFDGATMTQYEFGCRGSVSYQTASGTQSKLSRSLYGKLVIDYETYLHHNGVNVPYEKQNTINGGTATSLTDAQHLTAGQSYSKWKYPELDIYAPRSLNTVEVKFADGCDSRDSITYDAQYATAIGVTVHGDNKGWTFVTNTRNSVTEAQWETLLRGMTFTVYERISAFVPGSGIQGGVEVSWAGSEDQQQYPPTDGLTNVGIFNDHAYAVVTFDSELTWEQARIRAKEYYNPDIQEYGYLANITSAVEQQYFYSQAKIKAPNIKGWLGGYRDGLTWKWADGPEAGTAWFQQTSYVTHADYDNSIWWRIGGSPINGMYNNWAGGEPNDSHAGGVQGEPYLHYYGDTGLWNDYPLYFDGVKAIIVEFGGGTKQSITSVTHCVEDTDRIGTQLPFSVGGEIKVTVGDKSKVYDGAELMPDILVSSNQVSNPAQYVQATYSCSTATAGYTNRTLPAAATSGDGVINAGTYTVTLTLTQDAINAGYGFTADSVTSATLTIRRRPISIASTDNNKVYDGSNAATIQNIRITDGVVNGDNVTLTSTTAAGKYSSANTGSWDISRTGRVALQNNPYSNYYIANESYSGSISARPLKLHSLYQEVPGITRNIKQYDGNDSAIISRIIVENIVDGDPVALNQSSYHGVYATANAGETLNADGRAQENRLLNLAENVITRTEAISLINDPNGNYYIAEENYSGAIYRRAISVGVGNFTHTYGNVPSIIATTAGTYSATEAGQNSDLQISALIAGDTLTIDDSKSGFVMPDVTAETICGDYKVSYTGLNESNYPILSNYIVWLMDGSVAVTPRPLIIRAGDYKIEYGDPIPDFQPIFEGFVNGNTPQSDLNGQAQFSTTASAQSDVGRYEVKLEGYSAKLNRNGVPNYVVYHLPGTLTIVPKTVVIVPDPDPDPKPEPDPIPTLRRVTVAKSSDKTQLVPGETATYTVVVTNIGNIELVNLPVKDEMTNASGAIQASSGQGYTWQNGTFIIERLPVGRSITLSYQYTAQVADEGKTIQNIAVATVPSGEEGGEGTRIPSNEVDIPVVPGTPEPDPGPTNGRSISILKTADKQFAKPGDVVSFSAVVTNNGTVDLTNVKVFDLPYNYAGSITLIDGTGYSWQADGVALIPTLPVGQSVTIHFSYTVLEGDKGVNLMDIVVGKVPGCNPPDPQHPDTGITDPDLPVTPDEEFVSNEVVVAVDSDIMVVAEPKTKYYGDADQVLTYSISIPVDTAQISGDIARVPGEEVGVYPILQNTLTSRNYNITYIPAIFQIKPVTLYLTADDKTKVYGEENPILTAQVTGFRFADTLENSTDNNYVLDTPATRTSDVGKYPIIPSGLTIPDNGQSNKNYLVQPVNGTLTITPKPIVITPDPGDGRDPKEPQIRQVDLRKSVDMSRIAIGDTASYKVVVTNTGNVELTNIEVRDVMTGASGTISAKDGQGYTFRNGKFLIERLPAGKSITLTYTYTGLEADANKTIQNYATTDIGDYNPEEPKTPGYGKDPNKPINNYGEYSSNKVEVTVDPAKTPEPTPGPVDGHSVSILKAADKQFVKVGDVISYTATITNNGTLDLVNVKAWDVPSNVVGSVTLVDGEGYTWQDGVAIIPSLAVGESVTLNLKYSVQAGDAGKNLHDVVVADVTGPNPPGPNRPDQGIDITKPVTPNREYTSNEVIVAVDPVGVVAADPQVKVYGDADPKLTYTLPELVKPDDIWGELVRVPGEETGTYMILQGTVDSKNYDITFIPSRLIIIQAPLTITADDKIRSYKSPEPPFTEQYKGFKFDDGPEDLLGELSLTTTAIFDSAPGNYPIIPSGLYSKNYDITYINGTLTILDNGICIKKVDAETGEPLEGAYFAIRDKDTKKLLAFRKTNEEGILWVNLPYDGYTYQEIWAPRGYEVDGKIVEFTINGSKTSVSFTVPNKKLDKSIIPQTGDDMPFLLLLLALSLSGAGILFLLYQKRKQSK